MGNHLYYGDNLSVLRSGKGSAAEMLWVLRSLLGENVMMAYLARLGYAVGGPSGERI